MDNRSDNTPNKAVMNALATVGFIALIGASMWLAVYSSTRYIPSFVTRVGSAAVYLGSVFIPSPKPGLSVVPTSVATTTIYFGEASSTILNETSAHSKPIVPKQIRPTAGTKTNNAYQIGSTTVAMSSAQNGLPDFIVRINAIGYLATSSAESFIASSTVPSGNRPAVRFTIKNIGKGATGQWRFSASIPTQSAYIYQSQLQQSLNSSGDSIDYTLGFDQASSGAGKTISITANFDNSIAESNTNNNTASTTITILSS